MHSSVLSRSFSSLGSLLKMYSYTGRVAIRSKYSNNERKDGDLKLGKVCIGQRARSFTGRGLRLGLMMLLGVLSSAAHANVRYGHFGLNSIYYVWDSGNLTGCTTSTVASDPSSLGEACVKSSYSIDGYCGPITWYNSMSYITPASPTSTGFIYFDSDFHT